MINEIGALGKKPSACGGKVKLAWEATDLTLNLDDMSNAFYGENKTFLTETIGMNTETLDNIKYTQSSADFFLHIKEFIGNAVLSPDAGLSETTIDMAKMLQSEIEWISGTADQTMGDTTRQPASNIDE